MKLISKILIITSAVMMTAAAFAENIWFSWNTNPSEQLVSTYRLEYQKLPAITNWTLLTTVASTTNAVQTTQVKGIQSGYIYKFRIFAVNAIGTGTEQSTIVQIPTNAPTGVQSFQLTK